MGETRKGTLTKTKKGAYMLNHQSSNGKPMSSPIPSVAKCFADVDYSDGIAVEYEVTPTGQIGKVWIPGKPLVTPSVMNAESNRHSHSSRPRPQGGASPPPVRDRDSQVTRHENSTRRVPQQQAHPRYLGLPFTNPYTFKPFQTAEPKRFAPVWRTAEELCGETGHSEKRYTGFMDLKVTTQRPLLSSLASDNSRRDTQQHEELKGLCIGDSLIVPRTGIRGCLRSLMALVSDSGLTQIQPRQHLCQGRDLVLLVPGFSKPIDEVRAKSSDSSVAFGVLARVVKPGTHLKPGIIEMGDTKLVFSQDLIRAMDATRGMDPRNFRKLRRPLYVSINERGDVISVSDSGDQQHPWEAKVSGMPIGGDGHHRNKHKREGIFLGTGEKLTLEPAVWEEFDQRYESAAKSTLKKGDLIWLELNSGSQSLKTAADVASLQWARWGRRGVNVETLLQKHHPHVMPDNRRQDGKVDSVTALFGQIADADLQSGDAFAARIFPENLVFPNARAKLQKTTLAALGRPHPGCLGFYRQGSQPSDISRESPLAGRKVYRVSAEGDQPWLWQTQPVFHADRPKPPRDSQNKTVELLPAHCEGLLRISFRSLSRQELALLVAVCELPWRLGGGKPLGLGLCSLQILSLCDELGGQLSVENWMWEPGSNGQPQLRGWESEVKDWESNFQWWQASQTPVEKLRFPRAAETNNHGTNVGGHIWFVRHCTPKKPDSRGLESKQVGGELKQKMEERGAVFDPQTAYVAGQPLPDFDPLDPLSDLLFGYDGSAIRSDVLSNLTTFVVPPIPPTPGQRGENTNPNAGHRREQRRNRRHD